jgi:tripartite-type tricarboxylate transporter receptor subunit TctC
MNINKRDFAKLGFAAATVAVLPAKLTAQQAVPADMKIIVGFPPGGTVDAVARQIAERLRIQLGNTTIVENRPGAAGRLALEHVKTARPDGSVLLVSPESMFVTYPHVYRKLRYDAFVDFVGVGPAVSFEFALVVAPKLGVNSLSELVAWLRANSSKANVATPALGGVPHFVSFKAAEALGTQVQTIPFPGVAPALQTLMTGDVAYTVVPVGDITQLHGSGLVKALATFGPRRSTSLSQVPTMTELGYKDLVFKGWHGVFAPAGLPAPTATLLSKALQTALASAEYKAFSSKLELEPFPLAADAFSKLIKDDFDGWGQIIKQSKFTIEE